MDYSKDLHELCEVLSEQLTDLTRRIKKGGMSSGDLDNVEKLTHSLKSIKGVIAMMEGEDGYSGYYPYMGGSYNGGGNGGSYEGGSYDGGSYARGRGRNARRDSMGRYSGERGYSRNDLVDKMRELMEEAPDDRTRQEIRRLVEKMENA